MADITVKLFGVFRTDTRLAKENINVDDIGGIFPILNEVAEKVYQNNLKENPKLKKPDPIKFNDAIVYVNGEKTTKKRYSLKDGDEVWIMSPASGG
ncbi:MAG: MoaD/ThiS family protein [Clostridia bacterium]|nr:MoaD/ThiS family protein [Clostridia bacterium]